MARLLSLLHAPATAPLPDRLRAQRNLFGTLAVLVVLGGLAISLPHHLRNYHALKHANEELLDLQARIVAEQARTREIQAQITKVQDDIRRLQAGGRP